MSANVPLTKANHMVNLTLKEELDGKDIKESVSSFAIYQKYIGRSSEYYKICCKLKGILLAFVSLANIWFDFFSSFETTFAATLSTNSPS